MASQLVGRAVIQEKHTRGLGGGDAVAVLGLSKYRSPTDVWLQKRGAQSSYRDSPAARLGTLLEPFVAGLYAEATSRELLALSENLVHPTRPYLVGQVDRLVNGEMLGVEIKVTSSRRGYGATGSSEVPVQPYVQAQHLMQLTGFPFWDVAALIEGTDFRILTVPADRAFGSFLEQYLVAFWERHVVDGVAPEQDGPRLAAASWTETTRKLVDEGFAVAEGPLDAVAEMYFQAQTAAALINGIRFEAERQLYTAARAAGGRLRGRGWSVELRDQEGANMEVLATVAASRLPPEVREECVRDSVRFAPPRLVVEQGGAD